MNSDGDPGTDATPSGSPLDKPLAELTEEDIAQLTREDCRRFLKAKGMRRPSWNKSQAIQQVISLKALLEGRPGEDDCPVAPGILRKHPPPSAPSSSPPTSTPTLDAADSSTRKELTVDVYTPAKEPSSYRRRDPTSPHRLPGELCPVAGKDRRLNENLHLSPSGPAANQMTIFYDGRIIVYNDVTPEQARLIMELAASRVRSDGPSDPVFLPFRSPVLTQLPSAHFPISVPGSGAPVAAGSFPASTSGRWSHHVADGGEARESENGSTSRKASLQRYLEKRRDRFKGKRIPNLSGSSSAEVLYLSQKLNNQNHFEQFSQKERCSPSLPQPPGTPNKCSSIENRFQNERVSFDLNDDGAGD